MTPVDTLGEPVTVVDALGEPVVLINNDGTPAFLAYSAKTYLGGVAPYHWLDFINNRALYAGADVGTVAGGTGYSFTRASDGYYENADGTLTLFGSGALRRGDRGVLIEGARTNLLVRSQEFDNAAWTKGETTVTANATTAPDGTTTADLIIPSVASAGHYVIPASSYTVPSAGSYQWSLFVKASGYSKVALRESGATGAFASFNLATGVVLDSGSAGGHTITNPSITAVGGGYYRILMTLTTSGATTITFGLWVLEPAYASGAPTSSWTGDGTSGIYLWGAQLEAASFPSSYIPTVAAAATRASDVLTYTAGVSYPLQLWSEFERAVDTGAQEGLVRLDTGSANPKASLFVDSIDRLGFELSTDGAQAVAGSIAVGVVTKGAARYATNDLLGALGGTLSPQDATATEPTAPTRIIVGDSSHNNTMFMFGYIRRIAVIQGAGTDANLIAMTS
jgi:hypothetical protein